MSELTHIVVSLRGGCWERLQKLVTDPDGPIHGEDGGFQRRKAKWRTNLNLAAKSIVLDANDTDWVKRHIANRRNGGWQQKIADIFAGQHKEFSRIEALPRKKPGDRKPRKPRKPCS